MSAAPILKILKDGEDFLEKRIDHELLIGRGDDCVIQFPDRAVSRHHALIRPNGEKGIQIEKKSEFASVEVNGADVTSAVLQLGDVISIGPYLIKVISGEGEEDQRSEKRPHAPAVAQDSFAPVVQETMQLLPDSQDFAVADLTRIPAPAETMALSVGQAEKPQEEEPLFVTDSAPGEVASEIQAAPASDQDGVIELNSPLEGGEAKVEVGDAVELPPMEEIEKTTPTLEGMQGLGPQSVEEYSAIGESEKTRPIATQAVNIRLQIPEGKANVTEYALTDAEVFIGRSPQCQIVLTDKKASRQSAVIKKAGINFVVQDMGSANGVFVNDQKVTQHELSSGDVIRIGDTPITFSAVNEDYFAKEHQFLKPIEDESPVHVPPIEEQVSFIQSPIQQQQTQGGQNQYQSPVMNQVEGGLGGGFVGVVPLVEPMIGVQTMGAGIPREPKSLVEKFKNLPPRRKLIYMLLGAGLLWVLLDETPETPPPQAKKETKADQKTAGKPTFETLTPEQQKFVQSQHSLAFDLYRNKEYDKALFEIRKIFALVEDYKDSREIERYSLEGQRKLEALKEEQKRREEEARVKALVTQLVAQAEELMKAKKYAEADALFPEILAVDPDNAQVAQWKKEIENYLDEQKQAEEAARIREELNKTAWGVYAKAKKLHDKGKYLSAINAYRQVAAVGAPSKSVNAKAREGIDECEEQITAMTGPLLEDAQSAEKSEKYIEAYKLYEKARKIDPRNKASYQGMGRISDILHERAKVIYTEAVLAESYSDFKTAKEKFQQCLDATPEGDEYHERAMRKIKRYSAFENGQKDAEEQF